MNDYQLLALGFHHPDPSLLEALRDTELFREALKNSSIEDMQKEYTRLFSLTVAGGIPPYETEYGHKDIFFKTQRLADISGFYRAFGMEISDTIQERVDFIGAELEFMHWISLKEELALDSDEGPSGREQDLSPIQARIRLGRSERIEQSYICQDAASKFLMDHLGRWGSYFGDQMAKTARHPFYVLLGRSIARLIETECDRLRVKPDRVTGWAPEPVPEEFVCGMEEGESRCP